MIRGNGFTRRQRFKYSTSLVLLISLIWFLSSPGTPVGTVKAALAASDPVIAAAGDIACDPTNSNFNNGNGTVDSCRQKYTSDLLVNGGFSAVLSLGDNQYYCGGYQAFLQAYDLRDRKSTRLNSSHIQKSRMPSSA